MSNLAVKAEHEEADEEEDGPERSKRKLSDGLWVSNERKTGS